MIRYSIGEVKAIYRCYDDAYVYGICWEDKFLKWHEIFEPFLIAEMRADFSRAFRLFGKDWKRMCEYLNEGG